MCVGVTVLLLATGVTLAAEVLMTDPGAAPPSPDYEAELVTMPIAEPGSNLTLAGTAENALGTFTINVVPGAGLAANSAALAAFGRAAAQWSCAISDPITVNINADMQNLGSPNIIGQSSTVVLAGGYTLMRDAMVADADADDGILAFLPTVAQYSVYLPSGIGLSGTISASKANCKALGFAGLDQTFGATDATITFNTGFAFDYDKGDGVSPGTMDFETVAAHELGHALGFVSEVNTIDYYKHVGLNANVSIGALDMFRFDNAGAYDPSTAAEFTTFPRSMVPNNDEITDDIGHEWRMSTGYYVGDGRQAAHWKDDGLTGSCIGIMDPTLGYQEVWTAGSADFRALDLIGYDIIPEPAALSLLALGGAGCLLRCRRK